MQKLAISEQSVHQKRGFISLIRFLYFSAYFLRGIYHCFVLFFCFVSITFVTATFAYKTPRRFRGVYPEAGNLATDNLGNRCIAQFGVQWEKKKKGCLVSFVCNNEAQIKRRVEGDTKSKDSWTVLDQRGKQRGVLSYCSRRRSETQENASAQSACLRAAPPHVGRELLKLP